MAAQVRSPQALKAPTDETSNNNKNNNNNTTKEQHAVVHFAPALSHAPICDAVRQCTSFGMQFWELTENERI